MKKVVLGEATVTARHNVVLIREVLPHLKVKAGDKVRYVLVNNTVTLTRVGDVNE